MSKKNKAEGKKPEGQIANVPDPAVPNRAHTEMKNGSECKNDLRANNKRK